MVTWEFPPLLVGGLGRHVSTLAPALAEAGHEVHVVTLGSEDDHATSAAGLVTVHRTPRLLADPTDLLAWAKAGERLLTATALEVARHWRPDVLHGHDWLTAGTVEAVRSAIPQAKAVVTMHATETGRQQGYLTSALQRRIHAAEHRMCTAADAVLVCSNFMAQQVGTLFGIPPARLTVIGNGVETGPGLPQPADPSLLVFAGRVVHEKGLQELIKALPLLEGQFPNLRLTVAGTGPLLAAQQDRARRYRVADRIDWPGFLDDERLRQLLSRAAAVVVPSLYEPFGLVALEAQAAGAPVAASNTGGLPELIEHDRTGVLFEPESPVAVAEAVVDLLGSPARSARIAKAALRQAETRFSWSSVASRTAAVYQALTAT